MFKKYPQITFTYNRFLDPIFIAYVKSLPQHKDWIIPDIKNVKKSEYEYRFTWSLFGDKILKGIMEATGMSFKRSLIPVYIVSGNPRPFNNPFIITHRYSVNEFLKTMIHELVHCLFTDNDINDEMVRKVFPHADPATSAHIPVYAVMEYVYNSLIKDNTVLTKSEYESAVNASYDAAIEQVKKHGYTTIIKAIKKELC